MRDDTKVHRADERSSGTAPLWAATGVFLLFAFAVWRLGARGVDTLRGGLDPVEWTALVLLTAAFVYGEGYRALERRYVPYVLARARELDGRPLWLRLAAPLYAMSLVGAPVRDTLRAWLGLGLIVLAVVIVQAFPAPWRGITDFAVAAALLWGMVAIVRRWLAGSAGA